MHRQRLHQLLESYHPFAPEEQVYKKQIQDFIHLHPDCFERSCELGHITASSFVLNYDRTQALLMHHAKLHIWLQLGGHCDGDSDIHAVALKEAQEESGMNSLGLLQEDIYDIDVHLVPSHGHERAHYHYDIRFLLQVTDAYAAIQQNEESLGLQWFGKDVSALPTQERSVVRLFEKWSAYSASCVEEEKWHII